MKMLLTLILLMPAMSFATDVCTDISIRKGAITAELASTVIERQRTPEYMLAMKVVTKTYRKNLEVITSSFCEYLSETKEQSETCSQDLVENGSDKALILLNETYQSWSAIDKLHNQYKEMIQPATKKFCEDVKKTEILIKI